MRRWTNVVLLFGQRRRRWANSKPTLGQRLMFLGGQLDTNTDKLFCYFSIVKYSILGVVKYNCRGQRQMFFLIHKKETWHRHITVTVFKWIFITRLTILGHLIFFRFDNLFYF